MSKKISRFLGNDKNKDTAKNNYLRINISTISSSNVLAERDSYYGGTQGHASGSLGGIINGSEIFSTISGPWSALTMARANSNAVPGPRDVISLLDMQTRDSLIRDDGGE